MKVRRLWYLGSESSEGSARLWQAGSKGGGIAFGDEYKDRVTGLPDGHGHSEPPQPTPIRLRRTSPYSGGRINRSTLTPGIMWYNAEYP